MYRDLLILDSSLDALHGLLSFFRSSGPIVFSWFIVAIVWHIPRIVHQASVVDGFDVADCIATAVHELVTMLR